jgi:hypothetical protein
MANITIEHTYGTSVNLIVQYSNDLYQILGNGGLSIDETIGDAIISTWAGEIQESEA